MNDYLEELLITTDHDRLISQLMDFDIINELKELFWGFNIRILLSSFMIVNCRDVYSINIDDPIYILSEKMIDYLISVDIENVSKLYREYYNCFNKWRENDIDHMMNDITEAHTSFSEMLTSEEVPEWDNGIKVSMSILTDANNVLDKYSKSPPSF